MPIVPFQSFFQSWKSPGSSDEVPQRPEYVENPHCLPKPHSLPKTTDLQPFQKPPSNLSL